MAAYGGGPYGSAAYGGDASGAAYPAAVLPMRLSTDLTVPASALPMRLLGPVAVAASTLPMNLESADPAHFTAATARWAAAVVLGGVDISSQVLGRVSIEHEEGSSGICSLSMLPSAGAIDPDAYENQTLRVSFVGLDAGGAELYRVRRFSGVTSSAAYDPDNGVISLDATTDLQGWLENLDRAVIDAVVGGEWSEHVFDDSADGYQYAKDRLSTLPAEMHLDAYGRFQVVPWAAKATADLELTDAGRFDDTLRIDRVSRRDLITRMRINLDFRFVRLRHREVSVAWRNQLGFCHYLDNAWKLASKDMVRSAADGTEWTRIGDISFVDLPGPGTYCLPPRGWAGNASDYALGASWRAARRWAQTVTEEYALDMVAPDLESSVGQQLLEEDYGIEATYDATDFERITDFDAPPFLSVLNPGTQDWDVEATESEADGRAAMAAAQTCVLAKSRVEILGRARRNKLTFSPVYRPDITLAHTVRVNTPGLVAKGKVRRLRETWDTYTGALDMDLELALSRHGGSGLASDTPIAAATPPDDPVESVTSRVYACGYHLGGTTASVADSDDWDGYITNVPSNGAIYSATAPTYRERFVIAMPEVEADARDAVAVQRVQPYEMSIPEDELTMSA